MLKVQGQRKQKTRRIIPAGRENRKPSRLSQDRRAFLVIFQRRDLVGFVLGKQLLEPLSLGTRNRRGRGRFRDGSRSGRGNGGRGFRCRGGGWNGFSSGCLGSQFSQLLVQSGTGLGLGGSVASGRGRNSSSFRNRGSRWRGNGFGNGSRGWGFSGYWRGSFHCSGSGSGSRRFDCWRGFRLRRGGSSRRFGGGRGSFNCCRSGHRRGFRLGGGGSFGRRWCGFCGDCGSRWCGSRRSLDCRSGGLGRCSWGSGFRGGGRRGLVQFGHLLFQRLAGGGLRGAVLGGKG